MLTIATTMLTEGAPTMVIDIWQHAGGVSLALLAFAFGSVIALGPGKRGRRALPVRAR